jgi:chemotaxis protein CheD
MDRENELIVGIADIKVGQAPQIIKTNLGSCVAVCLYNAEKKVGGMLHLMLASSSGVSNRVALKKEKYADTGIPELLNQLRKSFQITERACVAKIFGGAKVLKTVARNIGDENINAVRNILQAEGIKIVASHVGGEKGYKVTFDLNTGKVTSQIFGTEPKEF